jgi:alkylated DNA repair dioxygenase AlkB
MKRAANDIANKEEREAWRALDTKDSKTTLLAGDNDGKSWISRCRLEKELLKKASSQETVKALWALRPAERTELPMFGQLVKAPRYDQSYGRAYTFSGVKHEAKPVPALLEPFMEWANACCATMLKRDYGGKQFNMLFVNWYENGAHYIGWHSDDESELYKNKYGETLVFSISLGQQRRFLMRPRPTKQDNDNSDNKKEKVNEFLLSNGDCLVMGGLCQQTHQHSVPKVAGKKGETMAGRINLTFRISK